MKRTLRAALSVSLLCAVAAGCAGRQNKGNVVGSTSEHAQEDPEADEASDGGDDGSSGFARMVERFDDDGDGRLQVSELPPRMAEHVGDADANGDGILTEEELSAQLERHGRERFAEMDVDGDGSLTKEEVGKKWRRIQKADADESGTVTYEELKAAHEGDKLGPHVGRHRGHRGRPGGRRWEPGCGHQMDAEKLIARFDDNGDGALEFDELPDRKAARLAEADANRDGVLSESELVEYRQERSERHFEEKDRDGDGFLTKQELGKRWRHVEQADADGDGKVSAEELEAARTTGTPCRDEPTEDTLGDGASDDEG